MFLVASLQSKIHPQSARMAVRKAKREAFTCKKKGNQQQYDHCQQVMEKFDESLDHFKAGSTGKVKRTLEEGAEPAEKRSKVCLGRGRREKDVSS